MPNQNVISTYPATATISAVGAHGFTLPELPDSQTNGSQLVQTYTQNQNFTVTGYIANGESMGGSTLWWVTTNGYVSCSVTIQQPDTSVAPMTTPPSNWDAVLAAQNATAAAEANPIQVVANGISTIWGNVSSAASNVVSGAVGGDITDIIWLVLVGFAIYAILDTGLLNTVHFKKKSD